MMHMILHVSAIVCFVLSAIGVEAPRVNLLSAGLACWALSTLGGY